MLPWVCSDHRGRQNVKETTISLALLFYVEIGDCCMSIWVKVVILFSVKYLEVNIKNLEFFNYKGTYCEFYGGIRLVLKHGTPEY